MIELNPTEIIASGRSDPLNTIKHFKLDSIPILKDAGLLNALTSADVYEIIESLGFSSLEELKKNIVDIQRSRDA